MSNAPLDVFGLAEKRLTWVNGRQAVLAQNIANANTPGYAARDVAPFRDFLAAQERRAGGPGFTAASSGTQGLQGKALGERSIDGNTISLDEQLEKVAETDTAHTLAINLMRKYESLFKTAIGRG